MQLHLKEYPKCQLRRRGLSVQGCDSGRWHHAACGGVPRPALLVSWWDCRETGTVLMWSCDTSRTHPTHRSRNWSFWETTRLLFSVTGQSSHGKWNTRVKKILYSYVLIDLHSNPPKSSQSAIGIWCSSRVTSILHNAWLTTEFLLCSVL